MDLKRLSDSITEIVQRRQSAVCAGCLTDLTAEEHGAENVDVRVAVVHLALSDGFTSGGTCSWCGAPEQHRNPVLRASPE